MRRINEALQFLIRKRTKSKHINEWKIGSQKGFCLNLAFQALEDQTSKLRDSAFMQEMQKSKLEREKESVRAQKMADEIASNLDGLSEGHSRKNRSIDMIIRYLSHLELVSMELNHFGVIAGLFRQIGGHSSRFVLFCSF